MESSEGNTARMLRTRTHRRTFASVIVLLAVISSVLAVGIGVTNPAPAYADHTRHSVKKEPASRYAYGQSHSWKKGTGGRTGSNGFYYAQSRTRADRQNYAIWWMGDLRGQYKLRVHVPRTGANPSATASVKYRIQEKTPSGNWRTVKSYRLNQATKKGWRRFTTPVTLNGRIRILVRDYEASGGRIAIDSTELQHYLYHPDDIERAVSACQKSITNLYRTGRWASSGVASLNPITGAIAWAIEGLFSDLIEDNESSLRYECTFFRRGGTVWLGPIPLKAGSFLSPDHTSDGRAKGVVYE